MISFLHLLDQRRQRGLRIRADIEIDVGIVPELLNVALVERSTEEMLMVFALRARAARAVCRNVVHFEVQRHVRLDSPASRCRPADAGWGSSCAPGC